MIQLAGQSNPSHTQTRARDTNIKTSFDLFDLGKIRCLNKEKLLLPCGAVLHDPRGVLPVPLNVVPGVEILPAAHLAHRVNVMSRGIDKWSSFCKVFKC